MSSDVLAPPTPGFDQREKTPSEGGGGTFSGREGGTGSSTGDTGDTRDVTGGVRTQQVVSGEQPQAIPPAVDPSSDEAVATELSKEDRDKIRRAAIVLGTPGNLSKSNTLF